MSLDVSSGESDTSLPENDIIIPPLFTARYSAFSIHHLSDNLPPNAARDGKIILPPSAFDVLCGLDDIVYPMTFKLQSGSRETHVGLLDFLAEEGNVYLPPWVMENLFVNNGSSVIVQNVSLPKAVYVKLQPLTADFLNVENPKSVLEGSFRHLSCLTIGDVILVQDGEIKHRLRVVDALPASAVSVLETDMKVDFEPPVGYRKVIVHQCRKRSKSHFQEIVVADSGNRKGMRVKSEPNVPSNF